MNSLGDVSGWRRCVKENVCPITLWLGMILTYTGILWLGVAARAGFYLRYDSILVPLGVAAIFVAFALGKISHVLLTIMFLMTSLCGIVLSGVWGSGVSDHSVIAGFLPFNDSFAYVEGSVGLQSSGQLTDWASRRPLSSCLYAVLLQLCRGNLRAMLSVIVFLCALSMAVPVREMIRKYGWLAGYLMFISLFFFYRRFIGTALSEHVGLMFGCLGFAFLLRSTNATRSIALALGGVFVVTLALCARAGTFFVLPALAVWVGYTWRMGCRFAVRPFLYACLAIGLGFGLNASLLHTLGKPKAAMGNFSYVLYGLVSGGNWTQVMKDHPELVELPEVEQNQKIYELALTSLSEDPLSLVRGSLRAYRSFFFSFRGPYSFVFFALERSLIFQGATIAANHALSWYQKIYAQPTKYFQICSTLAWFCVLTGLAAVGVFPVMRNYGPSTGILAFGGLGILASVPFVPPWDADNMRAYAATIPIIAALPALGASFIASRIYKPLNAGVSSDNIKNAKAWLIMPFAVIPLVCLLPIAFRCRAVSTPAPVAVIQSDVKALMLLPGTRVNLSDGQKFASWGTHVKSNAVLRSMRLFAMGYPKQAADSIAAVSAGSVLALGYDARSHKLHYLVLDEMSANGLEQDPDPAQAERLVPTGENMQWWWWCIRSQRTILLQEECKKGNLLP